MLQKRNQLTRVLAVERDRLTEPDEFPAFSGEEVKTSKVLRDDWRHLLSAVLTAMPNDFDRNSFAVECHRVGHDLLHHAMPIVRYRCLGLRRGLSTIC